MGVLISEGSRCPICNGPMYNYERLLNLTFVGIDVPILKSLDDGCVHANCIKTWKYKRQFITAYNDKVRKCAGIVRCLIEDIDGHVVYKKNGYIFEYVIQVVTLPLTIFYIIGDLRLSWLKNKIVIAKCSYCNKPLPSRLSKQCCECGMDWHDRNNIRNLFDDKNA